MESKKSETTKKFAKNPGKKTNDKKGQINNQIIQFQGKFKQAKVDTIRKLVQKLKHPEKKPKQNFVAKAERFENVLNQLKHTSPKRLGVLALIYYKSGKSYLADQNSTVEQLAVGYFTEHKGLTDVLDTIRNKLNLTETTDWKKSAKKLFRKKDKTEKPEKPTKSEKKKGAFIESDNTGANAERLKNKKEKQQSVNKTKKTAQTDEQRDENSDSDSSKDSEDEIAFKEAPTTVDEFFITADGSNYLSTAVVNKEQENDSDGDSNTKKVFEKKPREASFFHKSDKRPAAAIKLATNRFEGTKRKRPNEAVEPVRAAKETKIDPDLHPSWQAKQKLKPIIAEFKGKKITFD